MVRDDPLKPYKAIAGIIVAALTTAISVWQDAPEWFVIAAPCILAGLAVFLTPNPKVDA